MSAHVEWPDMVKAFQLARRQRPWCLSLEAVGGHGFIGYLRDSDALWVSYSGTDPAVIISGCRTPKELFEFILNRIPSPDAQLWVVQELAKAFSQSPEAARG